MNTMAYIVNQLQSQNLWEKELILPRNAYLKVRGSTDTNVYYIKSGSLRVFIIDEVEEHTIRFGYQNNIIVSLDSFLSGRPSELYIQAIKRTELGVVRKETFMRLIESDPGNSRLWQTILEQLIYQQFEREIDLLTASPVERYKRVLARSPQLFQEIPARYIASYLRMTPETLSRIKKH